MNLFDRVAGQRIEDDQEKAEEGDPRAQRRVSAELAAEARQVDRKPLPEPKGVLPTDEDQAAALAALAAVFVMARQGFDPLDADIPFLGKAHVEVKKSRPVRNDVASSWSVGRPYVGADASTVVGRNIARASVKLVNRGAGDVVLSPEPGGRGVTLAPGEDIELATTGPVYGHSATGVAYPVEVVQTFYGTEGV